MLKDELINLLVQKLESEKQRLEELYSSESVEFTSPPTNSDYAFRVIYSLEVIETLQTIYGLRRLRALIERGLIKVIELDEIDKLVRAHGPDKKELTGGLVEWSYHQHSDMSFETWYSSFKEGLINGSDRYDMILNGENISIKGKNKTAKTFNYKKGEDADTIFWGEVDYRKGYVSVLLGAWSVPDMLVKKGRPREINYPGKPCVYPPDSTDPNRMQNQGKTDTSGYYHWLRPGKNSKVPIR